MEKFPPVGLEFILLRAGVVLAEAGHKFVNTRCRGLFQVLGGQHDFRACTQRLAPFDVGGLDRVRAGRHLAATADLAIGVVLVGQAARQRRTVPSGRRLGPSDEAAVHAVERSVDPAFALPIRTGEIRFSTQHLDDPAHGIRPVQGRRRTAHDFHVLCHVSIHQAEVLVRGVAEKSVVQAHAVDQVQYLRTLHAPDNGYALAGCRLLEKGAGYAAQHFSQQFRRFAIDRLGVDDGHGLGNSVDRLLATCCCHLDSFEHTIFPGSRFPFIIHNSAGDERG